MAPNAPPGAARSESSTRPSPPRPRKTSEKVEAPSSMTKIIEVVLAVRGRPRGPGVRLSRPRSAAKAMTATAPSEADSVAVAMPARIEPRTADDQRGGERDEEAARQLAALGGAHGEQRRAALRVPPGRPGDDQSRNRHDQEQSGQEGAGEQVADRDRRGLEVAELELGRLVHALQDVGDEDQHGRGRDDLGQRAPRRRWRRRRAAGRSRRAAWSAG